MTAEPEPSPRRWGLRETAAAVGVATVIAAFGGAAIYAATEGSSNSFGAPHQAVGPGGGKPGGPGGPGGQHGAIGGYVIPNTAGNAGSPFAVDDHVVLRATQNGQTATVTNIGNAQQGVPLGPPGAPGGPPPHRE
jgi:hypothetical protein